MASTQEYHGEKQTSSMDAGQNDKTCHRCYVLTAVAVTIFLAMCIMIAVLKTDLVSSQHQVDRLEEELVQSRMECALHEKAEETEFDPVADRLREEFGQNQFIVEDVADVVDGDGDNSNVLMSVTKMEGIDDSL